MKERIVRVMDTTGDTVLRFDGTDATADAREKAKEVFAKMLASGGQAFAVNREGGKPDAKVTSFDAIENETILVPRVVGG